MLVKPTRRDLIKYGIGAAAFASMAKGQIFPGPGMAHSSGPSWTFGINFRSTLGYVTDGSNDAWVDPADSYPTSRSTGAGTTANVGYDSPTNSQDRNDTLDVRLAGIHFTVLAQKTFTIELPATGNYILTLALGDASASWPNAKVVVKDDTTTLATIQGNGTTEPASGSFADANNSFWTAAVWPGSNTTLALTFATTTCNFLFGDGVNLCTWAHIHLTH